MSEHRPAQDFDIRSKEYEEDKADKKKKLVRSGFPSTGKLGIPLVKKQDIDLKQDRIVGIYQSKTRR